MVEVSSLFEVMEVIVVVSFVMILTATMFINPVLRVIVVFIGIIALFVGAGFLFMCKGNSEFLGKPLNVQKLTVGKDLIVKQVMGGGYTLVAEYDAEVKEEDLRVVKDLPLLAQGTIFIVAERNGKKIVIPIPADVGKVN